MAVSHNSMIILSNITSQSLVAVWSSLWLPRFSMSVEARRDMGNKNQIILKQTRYEPGLGGQVETAVCSAGR